MPDQELYKQTVHSLLVTDLLHRHCIDKRLKNIGILRNQHLLLMHILKNGNIDSQIDIAQKFDISGAAITSALKNLEKNSCILRIQDSNDCRKNNIIITDKGKKILEKTHKEFDDIDNYMFLGFSNNELNELNRMLIKIQNNLKQMEKDKNNLNEG